MLTGKYTLAEARRDLKDVSIRDLVVAAVSLKV